MLHGWSGLSETVHSTIMVRVEAVLTCMYSVEVVLTSSLIVGRRPKNCGANQ